MRVFLTGATGFIGHALTLRLRRDGHAVTAWVRDPSRARQSLGADVTLVKATDDDGELDRLVGQSDAVVNLAGEPVVGKRWTEAQKSALLHSRVDITARLAAAVARGPARPSVFVSASAVGYYGDRGDEVLDETSAPGSDFLAQICTAWEAAAAPVEDVGVRRVTARFGVVLGPEGGALAKMVGPFKLGLGGRMGSGAQWMPWIHLADAVEVLAQALTDARYAGPLDVVAPAPVTNQDFVRALGSALGRPAVVPAPAIALRLALGEAAITLLGSQRVVPRALERLGFGFAHPDLDEALRDILSRGDQVSVGPAGSPPVREYTSRRQPRYLLQQVTHIPAPIEEVFSFFSSAENLGAITPTALAFQIKTPLPIAMADGAVIDYRIGLGPVPMAWRTVIHEWTAGERFADAQEKGPYASWWHEHVFVPEGEGTRMEDRVYYAPPLGPLGALANKLFIEHMLKRIFGYRTFAIELRFGRATA